MTDKTLTAIITTIRHGEKDETGALTNTGFIQAKSAGLATQHIKGDIILFHSGVDRVKKTILEFGKYLHLSKEQLTDEVIHTGHLQTYVSPYLHYLYNPKIKGEYYSNWDNIDHTKENINKRMDGFLITDNVSKEPTISPSPHEMYLRLLKVIKGQIAFTSLTNADNRTNFINGTHEPNIMAFLYYFLKEDNESSHDFIDRIGGSIGFAEGFTIKVFQDGENFEFEFEFRDIIKKNVKLAIT